MAGSVMAVMSGFVPPLANQAVAGTATIPISVDIVTAITLTGTSGLDFGRLAITGTKATGNHILSPLGATTNAVGETNVVAGTPGSFNISNGSNAGNVTVTLAGKVTYNAGKLSIAQITLGGPGMTTACAVTTGAAKTCNFAGGGQTDVQVGAKMVMAAPAVGAYAGNNMVVTITDIP